MAGKRTTNMEEAFRRATKNKQRKAEKAKADKVRKDGASLRKDISNKKKKGHK